MKQRLLITQIVNIIGFSNLMFHVMNKDFLGDRVFQTGMKLSSFLIIGGLILIIFFSASFLRKVDSKISSFLSPLFKYALPNAFIGVLLALFIQGCFFDAQLLKLFFLFLIISIFPIIAYTKSVFVILQGKEIRLCDYSDDFESISGKQITGIKKVFLGMMYKIKFTDNDGVSKAKYFFPTGNFFFFIEPASVKKLKSAM